MLMVSSIASHIRTAVAAAVNPPTPAPGLHQATRDAIDRQIRRVEAQAAPGPLTPGPLKPPDPTLGGPANVPPGPTIGQAAQDAATVGAFTGAGAIIGGVVGGVTIPVVGAVPGEVVGSVIGGVVGVAWVALF